MAFREAEVAALSLQTTWLLPYKPDLFSSRWALFPTPFQMAWLLLLSLSARPYFKCSAWNFLCDLISSPSYDVLVSAIFASSPASFGCHLYSRQKFPATHPGFWGEHPPPASRTGAVRASPPKSWATEPFLQPRTQFALGSSPLPFRKAWLLTCLCHAR